jgi:hypothetical protein
VYKNFQCRNVQEMQRSIVKRHVLKGETSKRNDQNETAETTETTETKRTKRNDRNEKAETKRPKI